MCHMHDQTTGPACLKVFKEISSTLRIVIGQVILNHRRLPSLNTAVTIINHFYPLFKKNTRYIILMHAFFAS